MQLIHFCLFTIIFGYSLVNSAPVNQTTPDSPETKQQKATAIAHRLLKELAGEQLASHHQEQSSNNNENKDSIIPINRPETEKIEAHVEQPTEDIYDDSEDIDFTPSLYDLYEGYGDKYAQLPEDEESSTEFFDDEEDILPMNTHQLMRYLAEQEESDEPLPPVIHTPVMAENIMKAENHRRRRSLY